MVVRRRALALSCACITATTLIGVSGLASADRIAVTLDGGAAATASVAVTVAVPAPTDDGGLLRLSDDNGTTWLQHPWSTSFSFSLVDPDAGGQNSDGMHTVMVEAGNGVDAWTSLGSASILLDRTGPVMTTPTLVFGNQVLDSLRVRASDEGVGVASIDVSLDGVHWRAVDDDSFGIGDLDMREGAIGGSWKPGERTIYVRAVDDLGNVTEAQRIDDTVPNTHPSAFDIQADYKFPQPAVTGDPFTIDPVFDDGFSVPEGDFCVWELEWGNFASHAEPQADPAFGQIATSVPPQDGVCKPWKFTLPYSPALEYTWRLSINKYQDGAPDGQEYGTYLPDGYFRATQDGTSRAVSESNLPLVYMLPDSDYADAQNAVTYRLYSVGGASTAGGRWDCRPSRDNPPESTITEQAGGDSFACPVSTSEPYVARWSRWTTMLWSAAYDPIGDVRKPVMRPVRAAPAAKSRPSSASVRIELTWGATDKGTGVKRYTVQRSRAGRPWQAIKLPEARPTSTRLTLASGTRYRFRARASDRAGNVSAWRYSHTVESAVYNDRTTHASWSAGWNRTTSRRAFGNDLHATTKAGATCIFRFTGSAIALLASRGPANGWAQVYIDGALAGTLNLHAASKTPSTTVWSSSWPGSHAHVLKVRALGTVGRPVLAIDAFTVLQ